jgi:hypothetical protein
MLKITVDQRKPKLRFHCACNFKAFSKNLRFFDQKHHFINLKLFHNAVTTFKAIYLDFVHYPSSLYISHNILEMFSSEDGHQ